MSWIAAKYEQKRNFSVVSLTEAVSTGLTELLESPSEVSPWIWRHLQYLITARTISYPVEFFSKKDL